VKRQRRISRRCPACIHSLTSTTGRYFLCLSEAERIFERMARCPDYMIHVAAFEGQGVSEAGKGRSRDPLRSMSGESGDGRVHSESSGRVLPGSLSR
jgi:hypothetical protein